MATVHTLPPQQAGEKLTLADIVVTFKGGPPQYGHEVSVTGRQIAWLLRAACSAMGPSRTAPIGGKDTGQWIHRLRGLSVMVFPDAGTSWHEGDARAVLADILEWASGEIEASIVDGPDHPAAFTVRVAPGIGREPEATVPDEEAS